MYRSNGRPSEDQWTQRSTTRRFITRRDRDAVDRKVAQSERNHLSAKRDRSAGR